MPVLESSTTSERGLGFWETLSIGVGSTIGGSIFVILGDAVGMAGPAVVLAFGLGAAITLLIALNYSELATSLPISGGGYVFTREAVGGLMAFVTGWFLWLGNVLYAALNAVGFALILARYLAVEPVLVAEGVLALFCLLNIKGVREVGRAQLMLTILLVSGLLGLGLAAAPSFRLSNLRPLAPRGLEGILSATGFTFVAYWGFESIATVGGEVREPEKAIPRACILSVLASGAIYMLVSFLAVGAIGWRALAEAEISLLSVGRAALGPVGEAMVFGLGAVAMLTSLNTALLSAARIAHALARDGLFPEVLVGLHPRFKTPYKAVVLSAGVAAAFALSGIAHFLAGAASFGFLVGLLMVNLSVILLRRRRRYLAREFRTPFYPLTPLLAAFACLALTCFMDPIVLAVGSAVAVVGIIGFFFELITVRAREAAIGGFSLASYLAILLILYLLQNYLGFGPNSGPSRAVANTLMALCVLQAVGSFLTAIPLGELYITIARKIGGIEEPSTPMPARVAKLISGLEATMGLLQALSVPVAVATIYQIYRGKIFFPSPPGPQVLPIFVLTCLALAFFALANAMCATILLRRRYALG